MSAAQILTEWASALTRSSVNPLNSAPSRAWYAAEAQRIFATVTQRDAVAMAASLEDLAQVHDRAALGYEFQFPHDGLRAENAAKAKACRIAAAELRLPRAA